MADLALLRQLLRHRASPLSPALGGVNFHFSALVRRISRYAAASADKTPSEEQNQNKENRKWYMLPPYTDTVNGAALGKEISHCGSQTKGGSSFITITALKWVLRCCPELPRSLVQKLFRLRKVRKEYSNAEGSTHGFQIQDQRPKRVAAKDSMNLGERIILPVTVESSPAEKRESCSEEEVKFMHDLVLHKDPAIIVLNKPPGMPVQGGIGIKRSLDELAVGCLRYDSSEPPRLVHRLDRDSSGILVMGRTQTSASVLHSIFREKTFGASTDDIENEKRVLQKRYWALVIGSPKRSNGLISVPLGKMVVDNGRSERTTIVDNAQSVPSQHAITVYRVIKSHRGFAWLELSPLTGRKHQLRVHCAEVLGTPIVGDYKYGWQAHRKWKPFPGSTDATSLKIPERKSLPFALDVGNGSVAEKKPRLHLHCKQMVLPNISFALQNVPYSMEDGLSELESLELDAPLPLYMQRSWDMINP